MRNSKDQTWRLATIWYGNIYHDVYSVLTSQRVLDFVHWIEFIIFCKDDQTILKYCICAYNYFFGSMVLIHHNSTCFVDGWQVFTCLALPGRAFQSWLPASRNLGYDYHCHVFWMGRGLCSYWHVFCEDARSRNKIHLRWKSWRGDHHRHRRGQQTNKRNHKNRMRVDGPMKQDGWKRT